MADRENCRVQWFDTQGNFLGQFTYGGQLYNVAFGPAGEMYISTHPKGVSFGTDFNVVKIDPVSGKMLGHVEARSHLLMVAPDGTLLPATRGSDVLLIRPRK